jgi:hypothetical protein
MSDFSIVVNANCSSSSSELYINATGLQTTARVFSIFRNDVFVKDLSIAPFDSGTSEYLGFDNQDTITVKDKLGIFADKSILWQSGGGCGD